ncbi:hypothetical protein MVLG_02163 [Microbotryum lychnidis-dioicae p1A1 Lamole]|uniref:DUF6534 domain-containing protein n=1 Tax=Microbotryum lychnidis-dioicae (strain p1A1 Lamole / MvSl-1064) TaxID=683840 RepID=U5H4B9_USTV1|nr:hypothetical protein MVLG_02163 [Microbotryum lychnidis-dioicae p1A1 Lamole]|eukprot:KDE07488.1 hypothetical protein MVLG_02163 [Microbotryum lychnidis-dioicae p1A1 Lamole]
MAGDAGPSDTDVLQYVATQAVATGSLGPFVLGMLLDVYLGGFALSLFLRYVRSSAWRADGWRLRLLLLSAMALSLIDIGSNYWSTWHYMTSQERAADVLYSQTIVDAFSLVPVGLVGSMIQLYLARRASSLFTKRFARIAYMTFIGLCVAMNFVAVLLYTILSFLSRSKGTEAIGPFDFNKSMGTYCWATCTVDLTITVALINQYRARMVGDKRSRTDSVMRRLIKLAIHSAMYTSTFALIGAILDFSFAFSDTRRNSTLAFQIPLCSMYLISLLVNLDSRADLRELFAATPTLGLPIHIGIDSRDTKEGGLPSFVSGQPSPIMRRPPTSSHTSHDSGKIDMEPDATSPIGLHVIRSNSPHLNTYGLV